MSEGLFIPTNTPFKQRTIKPKGLNRVLPTHNSPDTVFWVEPSNLKSSPPTRQPAADYLLGSCLRCTRVPTARYVKPYKPSPSNFDQKAAPQGHYPHLSIIWIDASVVPSFWPWSHQDEPNFESSTKRSAVMLNPLMNLRSPTRERSILGKQRHLLPKHPLKQSSWSSPSRYRTDPLVPPKLKTRKWSKHLCSGTGNPRIDWFKHTHCTTTR